MLQNRRYIIQGLFILIGVVFLVKLFALQVTDDTYKFRAERNSRLRIVEFPFRGLIYDRNNELLVYNEPIYDLMVIPQDVFIEDTTRFCQLLNISHEAFEEKIWAAKKYHRAKPSPFLKKISHTEYAEIQDELYAYKGFYANPRTVRRYSSSILANEVGYIGEISQNQLDRDTTSYYRSGDHIGLTGLEQYYEPELRGERGAKYKLINVNGIQKGVYKNGALDTTSIAGRNLITTIDQELQKYAEWLMEGKRGSIVAIEPSTGEILAMVSSPSYDPNKLSGREFSNNYKLIAADTNKRLFNRAIMAKYPPGSIFKTVQALVGLDAGVIRADEQIVSKVERIGDHAALGSYDVTKGIEWSSNNYFHEVMRRVVNQGDDPNLFKDSRIGMDRWADAVRKFGFGSPLGIDIAGEEPGLVPDADYYDAIYPKHSWAYSTVQSLCIGQGELLVTPIQVANLAAIISNQGYYIKPHLVKGFEKDGAVEMIDFEKIYPGKGNEYYPAIIEGMARAAKRTASLAKIPGIEIAGKTGTAENGIKDETIDHSVFMAFAPKDNPKIAISVYVENAGWGGLASGITASLVMEKFIKGEIDHSGWFKREEYIRKSEYLKAVQKGNEEEQDN
ncbi:MAG: peptidoglycan glycosyltransferase [Roseivirga sp.]|nr:peptidoglycan glycosyltransferase [Roseivirga sp.]